MGATFILQAGAIVGEYIGAHTEKCKNRNKPLIKGHLTKRYNLKPETGEKIGIWLWAPLNYGGSSNFLTDKKYHDPINNNKNWLCVKFHVLLLGSLVWAVDEMWISVKYSTFARAHFVHWQGWHGRDPCNGQGRSQSQAAWGRHLKKGPTKQQKNIDTS